MIQKNAYKYAKNKQKHTTLMVKETNLKIWEKFQRLVDQWLYQYSHYRGPRKIKEREGHEKFKSWNFEWKLWEPEYSRYPGTESTESPKQMNSKDLHQDIIKMAKFKTAKKYL